MTLFVISLLKDFVEKNGKGLEIVYIVSGWLKNTPSDHLTRLVSSSKLAGYIPTWLIFHDSALYKDVFAS